MARMLTQLPSKVLQRPAVNSSMSSGWCRLTWGIDSNAQVQCDRTAGVQIKLNPGHLQARMT